jgi:hypothetical protein
MSINVLTVREKFSAVTWLDLPEHTSESFYIEAEP